MQYIYLDTDAAAIDGEKNYFTWETLYSAEEQKFLGVRLVKTRHSPVTEARHIEKRMKIDPLSHVGDKIWQYAKARGIV